MEIFRLIHSSMAIFLDEETTLMSYLVNIVAIKYRTFVGQLRAEFLKVLILIAVFSRIRGNKILERFTVQDCNTPHSRDYRYIYLKNQKIFIGDLFCLWDFERLQL